MLKQRIITAVILIPFVVWLLFYLPPQPFCLLTAFVVMGAAYEWTALMQIEKIWVRFLYLLFIMTTMFTMLFVPTPLIFLATFFWWLAALIMVLIYPRGNQYWGGSKLAKGLMGSMVLAPCWIAVNYIRNENDGIYVLLFVFILIWGADSTAYFVGKKWGTTKIAPLVSPGKSIQGVAGALVFAIVITILAASLSRPPLIVAISAVLLSVVTVLFSILGDLFESMLKRQAGMKDSGNILPGHGGVLDRLDSLTAAAPIYALGGLLLSIFFS